MTTVLFAEGRSVTDPEHLVKPETLKPSYAFSTNG